MKKLIIGNWKLNPDTLRDAVKLAKAVDRKGVIICPPHAFLEEVASILKKALPCAQDIFWKERGSFTGGVSPAQLKNIGVRHTLVGHSSRRKEGENDKDVNKKLRVAFAESLTSILCVGEPIGVHKKGGVAVAKFVESQVKKALVGIKPQRKLIVAYEPIWAISTIDSKTPDTPERSAIVIAHIKMLLDKMGWKGIKVLYGGSANSKNAGGFLSQKVINGLLVGMASLNEKEFNKIVKINE